MCRPMAGSIEVEGRSGRGQGARLSGALRSGERSERFCAGERSEQRT